MGGGNFIRSGATPQRRCSSIPWRIPCATKDREDRRRSPQGGGESHRDWGGILYPLFSIAHTRPCHSARLKGTSALSMNIAPSSQPRKFLVPASIEPSERLAYPPESNNRAHPTQRSERRMKSRYQSLPSSPSCRPLPSQSGAGRITALYRFSSPASTHLILLRGSLTVGEQKANFFRQLR